MIYLHYKDTKTFGHSFSFLLIFKTLRASYLQVGNFRMVIHLKIINEQSSRMRVPAKCFMLREKDVFWMFVFVF